MNKNHAYQFLIGRRKTENAPVVPISVDFLTVDEVCELLKIGHNAAYRMLNTGELKAIRNGRVWRIPKQAIIEFTKEQAKLSWPYHECQEIGQRILFT